MPDGETLLEFPCAFSVKALGESGEDFEELVYHLVAKHVERLERSHRGAYDNGNVANKVGKRKQPEAPEQDRPETQR